jgi:hypothetical protein
LTAPGPSRAAAGTCPNRPRSRPECCRRSRRTPSPPTPDPATSSSTRCAGSAPPSSKPCTSAATPSARGFALTASGIGDNYQLHTFLADRLIGPGRLAGQRPDKSWVAAATDAKQQRVKLASPIVRRFRLYDGLGTPVDIDCWPASIPTVDGVRITVLLLVLVQNSVT